MTALKVFTESLKYLKEDALRTISTTTKRELLPSDFTWVLTVPAIWDSSAKQFMREAAIQVPQFLFRELLKFYLTVYNRVCRKSHKNTIVRSLPYKMKHLVATVIVIWLYIKS